MTDAKETSGYDYKIFMNTIILFIFIQIYVHNKSENDENLYCKIYRLIVCNIHHHFPSNFSRTCSKENIVTMIHRYFNMDVKFGCYDA